MGFFSSSACCFQRRGRLLVLRSSLGVTMPAPFFQPWPSLIIDTDMTVDVDDVGALCVAHALVDRGEAHLLAVTHDTGFSHGIGAVSVVNAYYGREDVPLGAYTGNVRAHRPADVHPTHYLCSACCVTCAVVLCAGGQPRDDGSVGAAMDQPGQGLVRTGFARRLQLERAPRLPGATGGDCPASRPRHIRAQCDDRRPRSRHQSAPTAPLSTRRPLAAAGGGARRVEGRQARMDGRIAAGLVAGPCVRAHEPARQFARPHVPMRCVAATHADARPRPQGTTVSLLPS
jgi:hypothetical protein